MGSIPTPGTTSRQQTRNRYGTVTLPLASVAYLFYKTVHMASTPGLGKLELAVLMAVATLGDEAYGLGIRYDVSARRKHDYSVGAIYTTLGHLERKGLVKSWTTEPLPIRGGRSRRQYAVTAHGQRALRDARQLAVQLQELVARTRPA